MQFFQSTKLLFAIVSQFCMGNNYAAFLLKLITSRIRSKNLYVLLLAGIVHCVAYCNLRSRSMSVCHVAALCKNGWTDWLPIWGRDTGVLIPCSKVVVGERGEHFTHFKVSELCWAVNTSLQSVYYFCDIQYFLKQKPLACMGDLALIWGPASIREIRYVCFLFSTVTLSYQYRTIFVVLHVHFFGWLWMNKFGAVFAAE